jgi:hypothetical protein
LTDGPLPPLYAGWVEALLGGSVPAETEATCADCVMCSEEESDPARFFDPRVKCCTFEPVLHNFLVGRILDDAALPGRASVEARIAARVAVTPLGLRQTPAFRASASEASRDARGQRFVCPHYEGGRCGIWRHRESTCATWFCKHVRGAVGNAFWRGALRPLLAAVEGALARWCLLELDLDVSALERLARAEVEPVPSDLRRYRAQWGRWAGREVEFYRACGALVSPLAWADVLAVGGVEVRLRARLVEAAWERLLRTEAPARLVPGELRLVQIGDGTSRVETYSAYDLLELPTALLAVLDRFDGRPTAQVLAALRDEGVELDEALVRRLADFEILVAPRT